MSFFICIFAVAFGNKPQLADTAIAESAGGLCLRSPHHSIAALGTPMGRARD